MKQIHTMSEKIAQDRRVEGERNVTSEQEKEKLLKESTLCTEGNER